MTLRAATRLANGGAAIFGLAVFAVYCATAAPGLTGGDSGELICAAAKLGVAHPPGYPLWTLLGHLFTCLPVGSAAWRLNLLSAMCAAGAAGILCRVIQTWTRQLWAGILAHARPVVRGSRAARVRPLIHESNNPPIRLFRPIRPTALD